MSKLVRVNRKDPQVGVVSFEPTLRINRKSRDQTLNPSRQENQLTPLVRNLTSIKNHILVMIHSINGNIDNHSLEVVLAAQIRANQLSSENSQVAVLVVCSGAIKKSTKQTLASYGADQIAQIDYDINQIYAPQVLAKVLLSIVNDYQPIHTFFADNELFGAEILRWIIAQSSLSYATDVHQMNHQKIFRATHHQTGEMSYELTNLIGLKPNITQGSLPYLSQAEIIDDKTIKKANQRLKKLIDSKYMNELNQLASDELDLEESQFIVSAGNGVSDFQQFKQLSTLLGASTGASRVVVDDGKLARDKQIGLTGKVVQAQVYLALGISGAIQHLQGIENCQYVIAVNQDATCPMVKRSNLAVIADLEELMPELIHQIENLS